MTMLFLAGGTLLTGAVVFAVCTAYAAVKRPRADSEGIDIFRGEDIAQP